ncbi:hypothetical protein NQ314_011030 [Rhamnusium bicolor]|uniref:Uncharacterized protein n=1 Tax=Rhamnusium bicolor TaxID=1586634 RepID=A0AAV8XM87_9CUCU|nr:hypothetical protein NQ314_011030 [Rhamnusium bicolor]
MNLLRLIAAMALLFNLCQSAPSTPVPKAVPTDFLANEFKNLKSLIPKERVRNITYEHLETDQNFKAAIKYMQSEEWKDLIEAIRDKPEWIALKKYLREFGIDLELIINYAEAFVANITVTLEPQDPPPKKNLSLFIIDVEQSLPIIAIVSFLHEKLINNPSVQELFEKLSNNESRQMIENVIALPEVKCLIKEFEYMGVNFLDMFSLMYTFFGWGEFKSF